MGEVQVGCRDQRGMRRGGGVTSWGGRGSLAPVGTHLGVVSEIWDKEVIEGIRERGKRNDGIKGE